MSDLMLTAVLSMPYDMAMENELSRRQFWDRAQQALAEIERLTAALKWEQHRAERQGTHGEGCANWGPAHYECLLRERDELRRQLAEAEQDARRYRDWLRGGENIPPESNRWPRWEVRHWNGRYWNTLFAEAMDAAIDEAMGLTRPAEDA